MVIKNPDFLSWLPRLERWSSWLVVAVRGEVVDDSLGGSADKLSDDWKFAKVVYYQVLV